MVGVGGYSLWNSIQDIGKGMQDAAKASSADTALRLLYAHDAEAPSPLGRNAEPAGRVQQLSHSARQHRREGKRQNERKHSSNFYLKKAIACSMTSTASDAQQRLSSVETWGRQR